MMIACGRERESINDNLKKTAILALPCSLYYTHSRAHPHLASLYFLTASVDVALTSWPLYVTLVLHMYLALTFRRLEPSETSCVCDRSGTAKLDRTSRCVPEVVVRACARQYTSMLSPPNIGASISS